MKTNLFRKTTIAAWLLVSTVPLLGQPGSLDATFNPGSGEDNPTTYSLALQSNGQIVIAGDFSTFNGANRPKVARLNSDGSLDTAFGPVPLGDQSVFSPRVLLMQPDGKILLGGLGAGGPGVARLRSDGSLDTAFSPGVRNGSILALALQPDGKVLVGGAFAYSVNGTNYAGTMARLNTNGTLDGTFTTANALAQGSSGFANAIGLQSNGQIIIGGSFDTIDGYSRNGIARLNMDGSVDTNFDAGIAAAGSVACLAVTVQDQIVIGGAITTVNGYGRNEIARLNADGSVDTAFNPGLGIQGNSVASVTVQTNGKVIVGGRFNYVNNTNRVGVARLNNDGSLDLSFNNGAGADNEVNSVVLQPDAKILIGGTFDNFNGTNINGIARLNGDNSSTTNLQLLAASMYFGMNMSGVVSNTYRIEWTSQLDIPSLWTPLSNVTLKTNPQFILDPSPATGQRFYRAVQIAP
jgi:uncharacterized delta-60 repeat protein